MKFLEFTTKASEFSNFRQPSKNFGTFQKYTPIRKPIGSGLKPKAPGSVSERYQTSFCGKVPKKFI